MDESVIRRLCMSPLQNCIMDKSVTKTVKHESWRCNGNWNSSSSLADFLLEEERSYERVTMLCASEHNNSCRSASLFLDPEMLPPNTAD